ncbi:hypothetical protein NKR19_g4813 [Coniochaeta hoffmannii]|uniref:DUF6594 domain-containing protein n=1 Tax=Coniochaeta hoffmannii TaxID=91930 RepID=A0AA38VMH8_9PEZI|nr:hypothetical protein NKR19_g4813 [Coniochaeta hoffmannii]
MEAFAQDHDMAEQGNGLPLSDLPMSSQPSVAQSPTRRPPPLSLSEGDIEGGVSQAGTTSTYILDKNNVRSGFDVDKYPDRFSAIQASQHNAGMFRSFGYATVCGLRYKEGRMVNLQSQLEEYQKDPTTDIKRLTAGQTRRVGEPYVPDRQDQIMDEMIKETAEYHDTLRRYHETQAMIAARPDEVMILYRRALRENMIDASGFVPAYEPGDFVYARASLVHNAVRGLLLSKIGKYLFWPILRNRQVSSAIFDRGLRAMVVFFLLVMLLLPTGLMYLLGLGKAASYGLVVALVVVLFACFVVSDATFERLLVGSCAYGAVLVTILLQTQVCAGCLSP